MDEVSFRFRRGERLRCRRDFLRAYQHAARFHTANLVVYFQQNGLDHHRLGLTVSKKIGDSVERNRVKRRLREVYRQNRNQLPVPADVVINAKRGIVEAPFEQLCIEFRQTVERWKEKAAEAQ